jgi:gluconokinase
MATPTTGGPTVRRHHVVVMGVSGSGKTTVAHGIKDALGLVFAEADEFHTELSVAKMRAGIPLTDEDRWPWLTSLADWMGRQDEQGRSTVIACSALRRAYRDVLRSGAAEVEFVHLAGPAELVRRRLARREGHYMPASLLDSQVATLEPLERDEVGVELDLRHTPAELVDQAVAWLSALPKTVG